MWACSSEGKLVTQNFYYAKSAEIMVLEHFGPCPASNSNATPHTAPAHLYWCPCLTENDYLFAAYPAFLSVTRFFLNPRCPSVRRSEMLSRFSVQGRFSRYCSYQRLICLVNHCPCPPASDLGSHVFGLVYNFLRYMGQVTKPKPITHLFIKSFK